MAKSRTVTGAGVVATAVLVLLFGNQAVTEWVDHHTSANTLLGWFLRVLSWPAWIFLPRQGAANPVRDLIFSDLRAILVILFVAVILAWVGKGVTTGGAAFVIGWAALILGAALAAFLAAFILSNPTLLGGFTAAAAGATYGLFVGWIVGLVVASTARRGG